MLETFQDTTPTMTKSSSLRQLFLSVALLLLLSMTMPVANATQVKWFGNNKKNMDPAATAPRSQRYWDKNNIKRPDYAKTDAELAAERGESPNTSPSSTGMWILLGLVVAGFVGNKVYQERQAGGVRLEGSSASTSNSVFSKRSRELTMVEQREARLARFDADMKAD